MSQKPDEEKVNKKALELWMAISHVIEWGFDADVDDKKVLSIIKPALAAASAEGQVEGLERAAKAVCLGSCDVDESDFPPTKQPGKAWQHESMWGYLHCQASPIWKLISQEKKE